MNFKKIFNKLLIFIFLISIISVPNIVFAYTKKVVLGGENIGIKVNLFLLMQKKLYLVEKI
ncbi:unknown [Mycoplasma sp. CAG:611]|nr:unknown [Mycoplasma sp. CAG:611]